MLTDRTELERVLRAWPSRNLEQLFDDLAHLGKRWRGGEAVRLPRVSLVLRSGVAVEGVVLDLHQDRSGTRTLVLHEQSRAAHLPTDLDIAHVPWSSIEAVTVHDIASLSRPPDTVPVTTSRHELERRAANVSEALAQRIGTPIALTFDEPPDDALEPLAWLLAMIEDVVLKLAEDHRFADAMRGRVKRLRLGVGHAHLVFADGVLTITTPSAWNDRATRDSLKRELEALL